MEDAMHSHRIARPNDRLRLYIGREHTESGVISKPDGEVDRDGQVPTPRQQTEELLSAIVGNARLLKLEIPGLPDSVSRRLDAIAENAQRIVALLPDPQGESVWTDHHGSAMLR
jgi:hypothetical protein